MRLLACTWTDLNSGYSYIDHFQPAKRGKRCTGRAGVHSNGSILDIGSTATVLGFYTSMYGNLCSSDEWEARIQVGQVLLNGQPCQPDSPITPGDQLIYKRPPWHEPASPSYLWVLHEDADVLALAKPSGLQVLPAAQLYERTVLGILKHHYGEDPATLPAPVHRLGRGTSGLLLCAKTQAARRALTAALSHSTAEQGSKEAPQFVGKHRHTHVVQQAQQPPQPSQPHADGCCTQGLQQPASTHQQLQSDPPGDAVAVGGIRKVYRALVQGWVPEDQGEVCVPIGRIPHPGVAGGLWAACGVHAPAASQQQQAAACAHDTASSEAQSEEGNVPLHLGTCTEAHQQPKEAACPAAMSDGTDVKPARSTWRVLHRGRDPAGSPTTLLAVEIHSGRPHQIRIHTAAMGHPLVGDPLYVAGGRPPLSSSASSQPEAAAAAAPSQVTSPQTAATSGAEQGGLIGAEGLPGDCGYWLHSHEIWVHHPTTGALMHWVAPPPPQLCLPGEECLVDINAEPVLQ